ncbi:MAG: hypothetical protein B6I26_05860 [Desulfobacteraceae bacterium 4572_130]|nr:MAG: hypothetical protein B6I26_05860 [Desulfobacteraceae bacterium 4572_130]
MLSRFSQREKNMIFLGGFIFIIFISIQFVFFPIIEKKNTYITTIEKKKIILKKICLLNEELEKIKNTNLDKKEILLKRKKDFTLFSFLDKLAQKSNIKKNVAYMKPSSHKQANTPFTISYVKVKLESIFIKDLVDFLYRIESSPNEVYIDSISILKTGKAKNMIEAVLDVKTAMINNKEAS